MVKMDSKENHISDTKVMYTNVSLNITFTNINKIILFFIYLLLLTKRKINLINFELLS